MSKEKCRLDVLLLEQGYFDDVKEARGWIMANKVVVDDSVVSKPGLLIKTSASIQLRGIKLKYASRGGYKLAHALDRFEVNAAGLRCLDAGASTGGFTDCLLQAGAARVLAVEVGYGQLRGRLACDSRVVNLEKTNIGALGRDDLPFALDLAVFDLSYLSVCKAIPLIAALFEGGRKIVFLIKPLYEGLDQQLRNDRAEIATVLHDMFTRLAEQGLHPCGICVSPIHGSRGAIEFLSMLDDGRTGLMPDELVAAALADLQDCPPRPLERLVSG